MSTTEGKTFGVTSGCPLSKPPNTPILEASPILLSCPFPHGLLARHTFAATRINVDILPFLFAFVFFARSVFCTFSLVSDAVCCCCSAAVCVLLKHTKCKAITVKLSTTLFITSLTVAEQSHILEKETAILSTRINTN